MEKEDWGSRMGGGGGVAGAAGALTLEALTFSSSSPAPAYSGWSAGT